MNYFKQKYNDLVKVTKHYLNPNENPTDLDKYAFNLLDKAEVETFMKFMNENDVNIHVVDFNKASLLIKAQGISAPTNQHRKSIPEEERERRALIAVEYLLKRGADINYQDKNGITALLSACHWEEYDMAELLLKKGANPNIGSNSNNFYTTPLLSAMFKNNIQIVNLLL